MRVRLSGLDRETLSSVAEIPYDELTKLANGAASYYHRKKKWVSGKERELDIPSGFLKTVQKRLQRRIFRHHSYHPAVYSCRGRGVLEAARQHVGKSHVLHLDITKYFPNVRPTHVKGALEFHGADDSVVGLLTRLTTYNDRLPQGCPTSTSIGDLVLWRVDRRLHCLAEKEGFNYTRYVDDITISGGGKLAKFEGTIKKAIEDPSNGGWTLNDKGGLAGPDESHPVLGLVVNVKPNIPGDYFRALRHVLRQIQSTGKSIGGPLLDRLVGQIDYVANVNPERGSRLRGLLEEINNSQ